MITYMVFLQILNFTTDQIYVILSDGEIVDLHSPSRLTEASTPSQVSVLYASVNF